MQKMITSWVLLPLCLLQQAAKHCSTKLSMAAQVAELPMEAGPRAAPGMSVLKHAGGARNYLATDCFHAQHCANDGHCRTVVDSLSRIQPPCTPKIHHAAHSSFQAVACQMQIPCQSQVLPPCHAGQNQCMNAHGDSSLPSICSNINIDIITR